MRTKEHSITFHGSDGAAVNVKLHDWRELDREALEALAANQGAFKNTRREFAAWYLALSERERQGWVDLAIEGGWVALCCEAVNIFGPDAEVHSEGRSGGWAIVTRDGHHAFTPEDCAEWTPEDFEKWESFEKACRDTCADLPRSAAWLAYVNGFEPEIEARETARRFSFFYDAPPSFEVQA